MSPSVSQIAAADSPKAWSMAWAAFTAGFVLLGTVYSFGVFLPSMTLEFGVGRAAASAYYSIASLVWYMLGPLSGYVADRIGPKIMVACGALLMGAGLILTAYIEQIWVGYLTYGLGVGLGAACAYVPTLSILGGWFEKKRNIAFGIAAAGTGCGMVIIPPLSAALIEYFGWRNTNIVLGIGSAVLLLACALVVSPPPPSPRSPDERQLRTVLRSRPFLLIYLSWTLATTALFVVLVYLPQFAESRGASPVAASALISVLGAASVIGRLGMGVIADRFGSLRPFKLATLAMAVSYVLWLSIPNYSMLVVFSVCLGIAYGIRIALVPTVLIEFCGTKNLGAILGVFFTATGTASLIGPPLAGYVMDSTGSAVWGIAIAVVLGFLGYFAVTPLTEKPEQHSQHR